MSLSSSTIFTNKQYKLNVAYQL